MLYVDEDIKNVRREQQDISCTEQKKRRIPYSYEEAIKELDEKLERLKARKRDLAARRLKEERKKRTKNLIEIGMTLEDLKKYLQEYELRNEKGSHTMYKFYFTKQVDTLKKKLAL